MEWNSNYWYQYGMLKSEGQPIHKNLDLMKMTSTYSHVAFKKLKYNAKLSFDGQLFAGYNTPDETVAVTKFMSPGFSILGIGLEYEISKAFKADLQPISGKFTFVLDTIMVNQQKYGLKKGKRIKGEPGATLTLTYNKLLWDKVNTVSSLRLFSNYIHNPQNVDVDLSTSFSLKLNKYVSTSLTFHAIYDDDIIITFYEWQDGEKKEVGEGKRVQFMEQFSIGLKYAF